MHNDIHLHNNLYKETQIKKASILKQDNEAFGEGSKVMGLQILTL